MALILVFLSTFLPILIGTAASERPYSEWTDGYFVALGVEIAGPWLGYWMMAASSMTNIGMSLSISLSLSFFLSVCVC